MGSRRQTGLPALDSQPSSSTDVYESAEEQETASLGSRTHSLSAGRRRSADLVSRGSSAASERTLTVDTASSPPRPSSTRDAAVAAPVADVATQLDRIALDAHSAGSGAAAAATTAAAAAAAAAAAQVEAAAAPPAPRPAAGSPVRRGGGAANGGASAAATATAAAAAATGAEAPGASMFSVPSASAPTTGIYSIPQEMFKIKDLDAGREYSLDQRYWIKDIDTGNVYVVEAEAEAAARGPLGAGLGGGGGRVTELLSGRELSLNQFEDTLGYFKVPQPAPAPQHVLAASATAAAGAAAAAAAVGSSVQLAAQKSMKGFSTGATWVKANVGSVIGNLKSSPRSGGGGPPGSPDGGAEPGGGGTIAALPAQADDRQGQPVKVQVYRKSFKEFTDLRLVQQLGGHQGVVWTLKFSRNGKFLASAGQDCVIRVWEVCPSRGAASAPSTPLESDVPLDGGGGGGGLLADPAIAVFQQRPYRTYRGHKQDVLDLSWSKTQFLLSASMDKTVRLWHISMDECLRVFKHTDFVTAIDFHPLDDKMFLSGSIDGKVRLWNIPEQRVVSWQDVHEMVTAVAYCLDGRKAVVGTMKGKCRFYSIEGSSLEYEAQLDVKNKRGQHSRGKKITGLSFLPTDPGKLLITSNDSRVRLYDGYTLRCKYKGHTNRNTQIRACFSPGGDYVTCGSDDGWVYVWGTRKSGVPPSGAPGATFQREPENPLAREKNASYECFQANGDIVTVAAFAPTSCHRSAESMSPSGISLRHQRSNSLGDRAEGEAALAAARARGQVLLTAGYTGEIRVYENIGLPQWL